MLPDVSASQRRNPARIRGFGRGFYVSGEVALLAAAGKRAAALGRTSAEHAEELADDLGGQFCHGVFLTLCGRDSVVRGACVVLSSTSPRVPDRGVECDRWHSSGDAVVEWPQTANPTFTKTAPSSASVM